MFGVFCSQSYYHIIYRWACVLAFDVRVEREAQELADNLGVKIFTADIIYHLFDNFIDYRKVVEMLYTVKYLAFRSYKKENGVSMSILPYSLVN